MDLVSLIYLVGAIVVYELVAATVYGMVSLTNRLDESDQDDFYILVAVSQGWLPFAIIAGPFVLYRLYQEWKEKNGKTQQ